MAIKSYSTSVSVCEDTTINVELYDLLKQADPTYSATTPVRINLYIFDTTLATWVKVTTATSGFFTGVDLDTFTLDAAALPNFNGTQMVRVQGLDSTGKTFNLDLTVNVTPVNDAPSGADESVVIDNGATYVLSSADFGFSDPIDGNTFQSVLVTSVPASGALLLDGVAVSAGQEILVADIEAGKLTYVAPTGSGGDIGFDFQVRDSGGIDPDCGGIDLDLTPNTITFKVPAPGVATLGDKVWLDTNANGVQDAGEAGLAGVTVQMKNADGSVAQSTTTDASGNYSFTVAPGTYSVAIVTPAGYVVTGQDLGGNDATDSDINSAGQTAPITLLSGQTNPTVDAGLYKLAELGDRVWLDANANGVQDAGEAGVQGVKVTLLDAAGNAVGSPLVTDASGNYLFSGLKPGTYSVQFDKTTLPAGYSFTTQDAGASDAADSDANVATGKTVATVLDSGESDRTWDAGVVAPSLASYGDKVWLDKNANGVQDAGEAGLSGVTVKLLNSAGSVVATTTTDASGNYLFSNLTPGDYAAQVVVPAGYFVSAKDQGGNDAVDSDIDPATGKTILTTLSAGENDLSWDAGLYQKASIGDKVWGDCNNNGIQDATESGVCGVTVKLLDSTGAVVATTLTDVNGNYVFKDLMPGNYAVQVVAPAGYTFTAKDQGTSDAVDSDVDQTTGTTILTTLESGENDLSWDAGLTVKAVTATFDFSGNTATDGTDGNVLSYSNSGISVNASAWSRDKTSGSWATAYLGAYGGGLGVTDSSEGTGSGNTHTVDNNGTRDNYVLFEFSQSVVVDKAYLGYVVGDSDAKVWIGTVDGAFNSHIALTDAVLTSMGFTEVNATTLTSARWADINAGGAVGNVLIIAANPGETDDYFKVQNLVVSTPSAFCATDVSIGDKVWNDANMNGVQDAGEAGIAGVTVKLLNSAGTAIATTTTDANGNYLFSKLAAGDYKIQVVTPTGYLITTKDAAAATDATDSDIDATGTTGLYTLTQGSNNLTVDAGLYCPPTTASIGDKVWEDMNFNGVQDAGEAGIKGVTVRLLNAAGSVVATSTTDANGNYLFSNVAPGDYKVQVVAPTGYYYTKQNQGTNDAIDSDVDTTYGKSALTTLSAGENDLTWDAGLYRKASIGDKVWEDQNHNYLQDATEPGIANVKVYLQNSVGTTLATTYTDSYGNYKFTNLDPGTYRIAFDKSATIYKGIDMSNWFWGTKDVGTDDTRDGDAYSTSDVAYTAYTTLVSGEADMTWDAAITPIVLDLDGNGIHTVAREDSTGKFDLLGSGKAIDSGWISSGDAFLAIDIDHNGRIESLSELFGGTTRGDGFAKLAAFDSNGDGVVDVKDAHFADLRVWQDANGNHQTDAGELRTLAEAGVASLKVEHVDLPALDAQGNLHLERSSAVMADGNSIDMADVYFNVATADAQAAGVELPSLSALLGDDRSLDLVLGAAPAAASTAAPAAVAADSAVAALGQLCNLYEEQQYALISA